MIYRGILVIIVLLVALLVVFFVTDSMPAGLRTLLLGPRPEAEAKAPTPAPAKQEPKPHHVSRPRPAPPEIASKPTPPPPPPKKLFPNESDLPAGMSREEIVRKFGKPDYRAQWSRYGVLNEKYIYGQGETATSVLLQEGKVVSSRTEAQSL